MRDDLPTTPSMSGRPGLPAGSPVDSAADARWQGLQAMKRFALGLLVAALAGAVLSAWMGGRGVWGWVGAFCEAAAVGALADWFAVTALFRHPLGLPIPHTAVIPANKARIGDNLAVFVRDHFLQPDVLLRRLAVMDPAARLGQWLTEPAHARQAADALRGLAAEAVDLLDEQVVRRSILAFVTARLRAWDAAATGGDVLDLLTRDGRHHELLDGALGGLAEHLQDPARKREIAEVMVRYARREWPRLVKVVNVVKPVNDLADDFADRLAHALIDEMTNALSSPDHVVRVRYEAWLAGMLARLKADPALRDRVNEIKDGLLTHPAVGDYVHGLWEELRGVLRRELAAEDTTVARHLASGLQALAGRLAEDDGLRSAINTHVLSAADALAATLQGTVTGHIAQTVKDWDDAHMVRQIELSVGRDLQFIRVNGTLVGGAIGLLLHAAMLLVGQG